MRALSLLVLSACGRIAFDARDDATSCAPTTPIRDIRISERHSCTVDVNGVGACTGNNVEGQLGTGTTESSTVPVPIRLNPVMKVSPGLHHTCALDTANVVWCWGHNGSAQLGQGNFTLRSTPEPLPVLDNAIDIEAMFLQTCALRADRTMWCWGGNGFGVLGDGTTTTATSPQQVTMGGLPPVDALGRGSRQHTCTVAGGSVWCWGVNEGGQIGDGGTAPRLTPFEVPGTTGAVQTVVGNNYSCARFDDGSARCWGKNDNGVLGTGASNDAPSPTPVVLPEPIVELAGGVLHVCARTATNALLCWGSNMFGQLGDGTRDEALAPRYVPDTGEVAAIAAGYAATCIVRTDGTSACWGDNDEGQLGNGARSNVLDPIELASSASGVLAGTVSTCIATAQGIACTGDNIDGAVGDGTYVDRSELQMVAGIPAGARLARSSTNQANCAFVPDDRAYCWGHGNLGTLGDGQRETSATPRQVSTLTAVSDMALGNYTACAIRSTDGSLWCWGNNNAGQLGDNTLVNRSAPQQVTLGGLTPPIQAVSASRNHTCAATATQLYCWGDNSNGKLGDGTYADRRIPTLVTAGNFVQLAASDSHTCALRADGNLLCWGSGSRFGGGSGDQTTPAVVLDNVSVVDVGEIFTCAVRANNTLWCWGNCNRGSCGTGVAGIRTMPVQVAGVTDAVDVSAGDGHTCIRRMNGSVQCWGSNAWGQLAQTPLVTRTPAQPSCSSLAP